MGRGTLRSPGRRWGCCRGRGSRVGAGGGSRRVPARPHRRCRSCRSLSTRSEASWGERAMMRAPSSPRMFSLRSRSMVRIKAREADRSAQDDEQSGGAQVVGREIQHGDAQQVVNATQRGDAERTTSLSARPSRSIAGSRSEEASASAPEGPSRLPRSSRIAQRAEVRRGSQRPCAALAEFVLAQVELLQPGESATRGEMTGGVAFESVATEVEPLAAPLDTRKRPPPAPGVRRHGRRGSSTPRDGSGAVTATRSAACRRCLAGRCGGAAQR